MKTLGTDPGTQALQAQEAQQHEEAQHARMTADAGSQAFHRAAGIRPAVYGRCTFAHARNRPQRPGGSAGGPLRRAPKAAAARRPRPVNTTTVDDAQQALGPVADPDDEQESDLVSPDSQAGDDLHHDFSRPDDDDDEAEARRRAWLRMRLPPRRGQPPAAQVLARSRLPGVASLFLPSAVGAHDARERLQALAAVLLACARQEGKRDPGAPPPTAVTLAALQLHLGGPQVAPMCLDEVKALLLSLPEPAQALRAEGPQRERIENALLLLPLAILNATRLRSRPQRRQAIDRMQMLRAAPGLS